MINISINSDGEITISQETAGERRVMSEFYNEQDNNSKSTIVAREERDESLFKQGWDAAVKESMMWFVQDRMPAFYESVGFPMDAREDVPEDANTRIAEAVREEARRAFDEDFYDRQTGEEEDYIRHHDGVEEPVVGAQRVENSGEPDKETEVEWTHHINEGFWKMSDDELQSRLDAAYERGRDEGISRIVTTRQTILKMAEEQAFIAAEMDPFGEELTEETSKNIRVAVEDSIDRYIIPLLKRIGVVVN